MSDNGHPRLFFLHIPKCAGMTLHALIKQQYDPEALYTVPAVPWRQQNFYALRDEWTAEDRARVRVVKGHMPYGWHEAFPGEPYEYVTILRHPVERALSLFSFVGETHSAYPYKQQGLDAFIAGVPEVHNDMTYYLSGGLGRDARAFIRAWKNSWKMAVLGTVENFDRMLHCLRDRYGWSVEPYERLNVTPERQREITPRQERAILSRNQFDLMLYALVLRRLGENL